MKRCKECRGEGQIYTKSQDKSVVKECPVCEGTGVPLRTIVEEQFNDAVELENIKIHEDEDNFIDFEERDYEV